MPGDRGSSWFKYMSPLHYVLEEYKKHQGYRRESHRLQPHLFAFGKSKTVKEKGLSHRLYGLFATLRKMNRRKDEIVHGTLRQLAFLTFDSTPVENILSRLGLDWLDEPNVQIWDLQREMKLELRFPFETRFEYALESLGLRFEDTRFGNLSYYSGNAAVFAIQMFLALSYMNEEQKKAFAAREPMPTGWLQYTWVGHSLDQLNAALGNSPGRREESQMNRHNVPQRRNEKAFN
ncbi:hypothetical protein FSARC_2882 [Fusarium sarcochroum]|uniref:Gfd2/YDR514C-like C-terminal domain-containing protein n=1 Tax=Fusarium sarcochroum TaxID=1208366 RepID=A0A8H4XDB6_9HYPO|nr:hypothetical protein FSARC_2882 [Fusarium sarcochroum]